MVLERPWLQRVHSLVAGWERKCFDTDEPTSSQPYPTRPIEGAFAQRRKLARLLPQPPPTRLRQEHVQLAGHATRHGVDPKPAPSGTKTPAGEEPACSRVQLFYGPAAMELVSPAGR